MKGGCPKIMLQDSLFSCLQILFRECSGANSSLTMSYDYIVTIWL